jgi:hypothetical protein
MDRNWNRGGGTSSSSNASTGGEKIYKQSYSSGNHNHYRKKNDFSGQEFYSKSAKQVSTQSVIKKEGLQVALFENELIDSNFSWVKNGGNQIQ